MIIIMTFIIIFMILIIITSRFCCIHSHLCVDPKQATTVVCVRWGLDDAALIHITEQTESH